MITFCFIFYLFLRLLSVFCCKYKTNFSYPKIYFLLLDFFRKRFSYYITIFLRKSFRKSEIFTSIIIMDKQAQRTSWTCHPCSSMCPYALQHAAFDSHRRAITPAYIIFDNPVIPTEEIRVLGNYLPISATYSLL